MTYDLQDKSSLPPRLPRDEAINYYNDKLQKAFAKTSTAQASAHVQKPKVTMLY